MVVKILAVSYKHIIDVSTQYDEYRSRTKAVADIEGCSSKVVNHAVSKASDRSLLMGESFRASRSSAIRRWASAKGREVGAAEGGAGGKKLGVTGGVVDGVTNDDGLTLGGMGDYLLPVVA